MLLTSTRAIPNAPVDAFSDYDVILVVEDIHSFYNDRKWLEDFGVILVVYWDPMYRDSDFGHEKFGNVTQYTDGLKIDFTLLPVAWLEQVRAATRLPAELDAGYRVLLDKDRLTDGMKSPTYNSYIPARPTNEQYQKIVNDFFSDVPYVAKCLLRDELLPAKWCLDYDMRYIHLHPMLEWRMELQHGWSMPIGFLSKGLKKRLSPEIWTQLESTYAGANIAENWESLFRTIALFREVAMEVGEGLGYEYPLALDQRVTAYVQEMQQMRHI